MSSNTPVGTRLVQNSVYFFFIGNNTFIEKKKIVFKTMSTLDMKKYKKLKLKLTDCKTAELEIQLCKTPNTSQLK